MSLTDYPRHFRVLEAQQTFYQPPTVKTMQRWRSTVPVDFEFTIKAWQLITHSAITSSTYRRLRRELTAHERATTGGFRDSAIVDEGWSTTVECARHLGATSILFQCPASFKPKTDNVDAMRRFFRKIARPPGVRLMWEPRGPWPDDLVLRVCTELGLVHVVDPFVNRALTNTPTYWRLHGISGARHVYSDSELAQLRRMLPERGDVYVMFNNMPRILDARRFSALPAQTS